MQKERITGGTKELKRSVASRCIHNTRAADKYRKILLLTTCQPRLRCLEEVSEIISAKSFIQPGLRFPSMQEFRIVITLAVQRGNCAAHQGERRAFIHCIRVLQFEEDHEHQCETRPRREPRVRNYIIYIVWKKCSTPCPSLSRNHAGGRTHGAD